MDTDTTDAGKKTAKYIIRKLNEPPIIGEDIKEMYTKFAKRILWIDGNEVPGAFQMNTAWWKKAQPRDPLFPEHVHDYDELIGFFGSDPEDPYDLGAVIEIDLDGETHRIERSSLIFVPGGMRHNPLRLLEVTRPVFHFSVVMSPEYSGETAYNVKT
ncbi:MAG: hypothetical protein LBL63_00660 [Clostridiales Family XIII bacterium]|jgi:hypothetical protein|nr:hypothetical protein [Clostridiales Family XIII bacterium]